MNNQPLIDFFNARLAQNRALSTADTILHSQLFKMVLTGHAKLPLDRVEEVATALNCDQHELFRLAMRQHYADDVISLFERMLTPDLSQNERAWLDEIRSATHGDVPAPDNMARKIVRSLATRGR
jgi:hypothetical protein